MQALHYTSMIYDYKFSHSNYLLYIQISFNWTPYNKVDINVSSKFFFCLILLEVGGRGVVEWIKWCLKLCDISA